MDTHPFDALTEQAAAGLKDDPELCLDVRAELRGHLEDAAEYAAAHDGLDPDAGAAQAVRAFGSPLDVAGALLDANRRRLRLRALLRLAISALLLPLAILAAVWSTLGRATNMRYDPSAFTGESMGVPPTAGSAFPTAYTRRWQKAMSTVEREFPTRNPDAARAAYERHRNDPDARMFYLLYTQSQFFSTRARQAHDPYPALLRAGERLDPDNAYYNYQLAYYYLNEGIEPIESQARKGPKHDVIRDQRAIDLGIAEFLKGVRKPYFHEYVRQRLARETALLPQPRLMEDYIKRTAVTSSILFPVYAKTRQMARCLCGAQRRLLAQGRTAEAEALLQAWKPFSVQTMRDADTLIGLLVYHACGMILAHNAVKIYDAAGDHTRARQVEAEYLRCKAIIDARKTPQPAETRYFREHAGMVMNTLYPLFGVFPPHAELAPGRAVDYMLAEEGSAMLLQVLLVLGLLAALVQSAVWYGITRRGRSAPLLLLPEAEALARVGLLGVLLPIAVYALLTRIPAISFRHYNLTTMWPLFAVEMGALLLALWLVPACLAGRLVRRRCETLGVPVPPVAQDRREKALLAGAILGWAGLCAATFAAGSYLAFEPLLLLVPVLLITIGAYLILRLCWRTRREYALYHGTVARSLAPVFALAVLLLAAVVQPALQAQEARLLRQDRLFFNTRPGDLPETRITQIYKERLLAVLEEK
jgi:hypothetical protein